MRSAAVIALLARAAAAEVPCERPASEAVDFDCGGGIVATAETDGHCCWPGQVWSHRRIIKLTLKNLPNLWGGLLLLTYFAQGTPFPKVAREQIAKRLGPAMADLIPTAFRFGSGMVMAACLVLPLVFCPDADYPFRSNYTTLFAALGHAPNSPVIMNLYRLVQAAGPAIGYPIIFGVVAILGAALGWLAIQFGKFNDRLFEQLGPIKHAIVIGLLLCMMGVLGKIVLRLLFGIKYLLNLPAFSLNI